MLLNVKRTIWLKGYQNGNHIEPSEQRLEEISSGPEIRPVTRRGPGGVRSPCQFFASLSSLSYLVCFNYFITNDILLKMYTGNPYNFYLLVYRLAFDVRISPD